MLLKNEQSPGGCYAVLTPIRVWYLSAKPRVARPTAFCQVRFYWTFRENPCSWLQLPFFEFKASASPSKEGISRGSSRVDLYTSPHRKLCQGILLRHRLRYCAVGSSLSACLLSVFVVLLLYGRFLGAIGKGGREAGAVQWRLPLTYQRHRSFVTCEPCRVRSSRFKWDNVATKVSCNSTVVSKTSAST